MAVDRRPKVLGAGLLLIPAAALCVYLLMRITATPGNLLFALFGFSLSILGVILYFFFTVILFYGVGWNLFLGRETVPLFSLAVLAVVGILSAVMIFASWTFGARFQSELTNWIHVWLNGFAVIVLGGVMLVNRRRPSFRTNLLFHWLLTLWITAIAFPYMGETP